MWQQSSTWQAWRSKQELHTRSSGTEATWPCNHFKLSSMYEAQFEGGWRHGWEMAPKRCPHPIPGACLWIWRKVSADVKTLWWGDNPVLCVWTTNANKSILLRQAKTASIKQWCEDGAEGKVVTSQGMPTFFSNWKSWRRDSPLDTLERVRLHLSQTVRQLFLL